MLHPTEQLLDDLETAKREFGIPQAKINSALSRLENLKLEDADALVRLHETLLFLRAYSHGPRVLKKVEKILKTFRQWVDALRAAEVDLSAIDDPEVSGIAGGSVTSNFSYAIVRWLVAKYPAQLSIDWDWFEEEDRFGATMPTFLPLLEDDAMVEAHVPYREWLRAAKGRRRELVWLIERFESLPFSDKTKANLYDSLKLHITWRYGFRASRTGMRLSVRRIFFHKSPLIARRDILLSRELTSEAIPLERLSRAQGERVVNLARETSAVRYRELHGFTYGDASRILKADLGRGTQAFVTGVPPEKRLPLRAYHAALIFKNGVPVAYFEGLSICERMESGFNLYYTFRDGETAWLYARILHLMRQLLGVTVFSIDPYQVGHENEEGIESGAFWFYRKLGFRPVKPELLKLTKADEANVLKNPGHRTSAAKLRKLAAGHMLFDLNEEKSRNRWDKFEVRNIGLAVQRRMAREFDGNAAAIREQSLDFVKRALRVTSRSWSESELAALRNLSLVLAMIPDLEEWNADQKLLATRIIRAKGGRDEAFYLKLMQKHAALRDALMRFGC
ncbi:MAG TPA: hypothetical protein DC054_23590 [Blastocatellia bacterium]|nr:hypothetical protein [Blastocatellia bacterium]